MLLFDWLFVVLVRMTELRSAVNSVLFLSELSGRIEAGLEIGLYSWWLLVLFVL